MNKKMIPFLVLHNVFAWWQLTSANYVEHYGLLRQKLPSGRYERCTPQHSWNSDHIVTKLFSSYYNMVMLEIPMSSHRIRLRREFQLLGRLDHPHLPPVYEFGHCREEDRSYFTLEFLDGRGPTRDVQVDRETERDYENADDDEVHLA